VSREPEWLLESAVVAIQGMLIAEHGGALGIRDRGLLESALARPRNLYAYGAAPPSLFELAAAYAHGLIRNHGFVDGNKRIALTAALTFLEIHGFSLEAERRETYRMTLRLATGEIEETEFGAWLAEHCRPARPGAEGG
jgi:death-on-curing protein